MIVYNLSFPILPVFIFETEIYFFHNCSESRTYSFVIVAHVTLFAFHLVVLLLLQFNDGDFQQVCTSVGTLQNNHENIHFRFRTLTMQMCCWIVDLNYLTL